MNSSGNPTIDLLTDRATRLSAAQARLFSNFTLRSAEREGEPGWTAIDSDSRRSEALRIAVAAIHANAVNRPDLATRGFQRSAEMFEWLMPDHPDEAYIFGILSSALYQMADLPAMSRSVLSQFSGDLDPYLAFLSGDFHQLESACRSHSHVFGDDYTNQEYDKGFADPMRRAMIAALGVIASDMRWSDDRVPTSLAAFSAIADFFAISSDAIAWLLAFLFRSIAEKYQRASLRTATKNVSEALSENGKAFLERYIRLAYRSERALAWPPQRDGIAHVAAGNSFPLCTPTGSGKTTVAEIAIIHALFGGHDLLAELGFSKLALYIVPSRALAAEAERRLGRTLASDPTSPVHVVSSYGGLDVGASDAWLMSQSPTVLVCTPEKADSLVRTVGASFLSRLSLLVIDEAHAIRPHGDNLERPFRLESLVSRLRLIRGKELRIIALSAVLPEGDESLGQWLDADHPTIVRTPYQSTRRIFGRLTVSSTGTFTAEYDLVNGSLAGGSDLQGDRPRLPDIVPKLPHLDDWNIEAAHPENQLRLAALWAAAHLARVDSPSSGAVLIPVGSKPEHYASAFLDLLERWDDLPLFHSPPATDASKQTLAEALHACADYFGEDSLEYRLLERGIVVHHGKLPVVLQRRFVALVDAGIIRICLSTSTLSEGVNLPFETILFPSLRGHGGKDEYSSDEILNVIGRAGRPGFAREGRALVLMGLGKRFSLHVRRYQLVLSGLTRRTKAVKTQPSALQGLIKRLQTAFETMSDGTLTFQAWIEQITPENLNEGAADALEDIDSFLMAVATELADIQGFSDPRSALEEQLGTLWRYTYTFAVDANEIYFDALVARARQIYRVSDQPDIRRIYRTGLRPRSAKVLFDLQDRVRGVLVRAHDFAFWSPDQRCEFFQDVAELLFQVPQVAKMPTIRKKIVDWRPILKWWLRVYEQPVPPKQLGDWYRRANDLFAYQLTWALSGIILTFVEENPFDVVTLDESLASVGLPRILLWVRDMMTWGISDPVAAALLQRGIATTRDAAARFAVEYYNLYERLDDSIYSREAIDAWIAKRFEAPSYDRRDEPQGLVISAVVADIEAKSLHVYPEALEKGTLWRDVTGYPVAFSQGYTERYFEWTDYVLEPQNSAVRTSRYV